MTYALVIPVFLALALTPATLLVRGPSPAPPRRRALAVLGIVQELLYARRGRVLSLVIYVVMGWLAVVCIGPLVDTLGRAGFAWLAAGGLLYTAGIVFYATDHKVRHGHGIWHLFVLAGSICHYTAVLLHVA